MKRYLVTAVLAAALMLAGCGDVTGPEEPQEDPTFPLDYVPVTVAALVYFDGNKTAFLQPTTVYVKESDLGLAE
jgi:hypothetical protein